MLESNLMKNGLFTTQFGKKAIPIKQENFPLSMEFEMQNFKLQNQLPNLRSSSDTPQRQLYKDHNPICKSNNQKLQNWLWGVNIQSSELSQNKNNLAQVFELHIDDLSEQEKLILKQDQKISIKNIKENVNQAYVKQSTNNYLKISVLESDLWSRNYQVQIGSTTQKVSGIVFNKKLQQFNKIVFEGKETVNSRTLLQQIINNGTEKEWKLKLIKIQAMTFEYISDLVTKIAVKKSSNIIGRQFFIYKQFGYDFILFSDYACFAYNQIPKNPQNHQSNKQKIEKEPKLILSEQDKQIIKQNFAILKLKSILNNNLYEEIFDFIDKFKQTPIINKLQYILSSFVRQVDLLKKQEAKCEILAVIMSLLPNLQQNKQKNKLISQAFSFQNKKQEYIARIQSLNKIQLEKQKHLEQFFQMLKQGQFSFRYGFMQRLTRSVILPQQKDKQKKQVKKNLTVFLKYRQIMLYFWKYFKAKKSIGQLQLLLQYFTGIGDQPSAIQLQSFILSCYEKNPKRYIPKLLQFFLGKKIVTVSFDSCLHTYHYIKKLSQLKFDLKQLQKQKDFVLIIMRQIKQCVQKRQFQPISKSYAYKQFSQFIKHQQNAQQYSDTLLLLKQIYQNNYLQFNKQKPKQFIQKLIIYSTNITKIKSPYLRKSLIKDYFYQVLFIYKQTNLQKLKQILLQIPASYRYGSLYWCTICQVVGFYQNVQGILNNNYLQLLKQKSNDQSYSTDLVTMLQIFVKLPKYSQQLQKLKFQLLILGMSKYLANVSRISDQPKDKQISQLRSFSQLMYPLTRQQIFQLDKMRQKLCCGKLQNYLKNYQYMNQQNYKIIQEEKQLYYHVKVLQITILLCKSKKKQIISILINLMQLYPFRISLYYYYLKIKYSMNFKEKKTLTKIIIKNIQQLVKQGQNNNDQVIYKAIKMIINTEIIFFQIVQICCGDSKQKGLNILLKLSQFITKHYQKHGTNKIKYNLFKHYQKIYYKILGEASQEQIKIYDLIIDFFKVKSDDDIANGHNRQFGFKRTLIRNPFLCYPLIMSMDYQKFPKLGDNQHYKLMELIQYLIIDYGFKQIIQTYDEWKIRFCEEAAKAIKAKISSCVNQEQKKRYQSKLLLLRKRYPEVLVEQEVKGKDKQPQKQEIKESKAVLSDTIVEKKPKHFEKSAKKLENKFNKRNSNRNPDSKK